MGSSAPKIPAPVPVEAPPAVEAPKTPPQLEQLFGAGAGLLGEGGPLRAERLRAVLDAWLTGITPSSMSPLAQQRRSNITAQGARASEASRARLESEGLLNSSYGNQVQAGIDRDVANMLVSSDTADLERLLAMGPALAQAGVGPGVSAMGAGAGEMTRLALGTSAASGQTAENILRARTVTAGAQNEVNRQNALLKAQAGANKSSTLAQIGTAVGSAAAVAGSPFTGGASLLAIPALLGGMAAFGGGGKTPQIGTGGGGSTTSYS